MLTRLPRLVELALTVVGCGAFSACSDEPEQGQVMVVVTSDMAVPTDFDTITWSVTLSGDSRPFATSSLSLERGEDLPATLSVRSGPKTTKPVTIRVEGRQNGTNDVLRVAREATLVVPTDRTAELALPLNWLCSDANLPEGCPEGQTCQAGECEDALIDSSRLPDYLERSVEPCLNVSACIREVRMQPLPKPDPETGECVISGATALGDPGDVNVALVVDNENVGNYGFCGQLNECYVMLSRDDGEGFRITTTGETPTLTLPSAVCDAVGKSIAAVAVLPRNSGCPSSLEGRSLCSPEEEVCLDADLDDAVLCPTNWPDSWAGYTCSGVASPWDREPDLVDCWLPPSSDTAPAGANGRACCTKGELPSTTPLLIDDMSGGPQIKIEPPDGMIAGFWWTSLGEGSGSIEPGLPKSLFTYRTFDPPVRPEAGVEIRAAACARSAGFLGYVAMMGFHYARERNVYGERPIDLSGYSGINFWGWAHQSFPDAPLTIQVDFPNHDTHYNDPNATCWNSEDQSKRCDPHHAIVSLTDVWKRHFVDFDDLEQSRDVWTPPQERYEDFDATGVYLTSFSVKGGRPDVMSQPFDFCIAHVYFTPLTP